MNNSEYEIKDGVLVNYSGSASCVEIPPGVCQIGKRAFRNNNSIRQIKIPHGVVRICAEAFDGCCNLVDILFPDTVEEIGEHAFHYCRSLRAVHLPENLKVIKRFAFARCKRLQRINIPTATGAEGGAFYGCPLTNVDFGDRVNYDNIVDSGLRMAGNRCILCGGPMKETEDASGMECTECMHRFSWKEIDDWEKFIIRDKVCVAHINGAGEMIPNGVNKIAAQAFKDSVIYGLEIPSSVTEMETGAFENCHFKELPTYPTRFRRMENYMLFQSNIWDVPFSENLEYMGEGCLAWCNSIEEMEIPDTVKVIGKCAASGCLNLWWLDLSKELEYIGCGAFENCTDLPGVKFPEKLLAIEKRAFSNCVSLKEVMFNKGLLSIGERAFECCESLEEITFPGSILNIGDGAFKYCTKLKKVYLPDSLKYLDTSVIFDDHTEIVYYSP